ncbi:MULTISPECIES: nucleotide sugar dehydrogenase [Bacillus]|uniref:nucleotide sugar dehydrogenase n=1 Tax=Bacillus TaxID=1386 RepID=UPI000B49AE34|nr:MULTISPECIES: nucleotide sugar dehydrogenase [Bacillus]MDH4422861.1 nucleotide sugar dehydrogenase [Bacillus cereus]PER20628.1 nucleotide sugar dehydrogenase [Bacillus cereus]PFA60800.1 nucleotide sugar dehydrogenase [Bacillus sp. AFS015896]PGL80450.1 nucleotide sugar dehydrogenase [Bacillus sp. AFS054943]PGZ76404.1 nucleotide sugar dehydrogenase [Bacillus sp. AFS029637]
MNNMFDILRKKIEEKKAKVGVIGLGYVGLPLSIELAQSGFQVVGIDINSEKVNKLKNGESYIIDIPSSAVNSVLNKNCFSPSTNFENIKDLDVVSICVPTPLTRSQNPDMSYIMSAVEKIKKNMHKGLLIILESTTYPGTTEELIERELELEGYKVGVDYFLCFSPERVDPGNKKYNTKNTPKVLGGTTKACTELGALLYGEVIDTIIQVSSPKVAEMSKLLENTFRSMNIAFINEMAMLCEKLGIDIWETIDAAATKPFGYMKFTPGPGIGGHCIPLDPMYLSWKAKEANFFSRFIELAQETNKKMPEHILTKVALALNEHGKSIRGAKILMLGMTYKPDIDDLRESPALEIYELLRENGGIVQYNDPFAKSFKDYYGEVVESIELEGARLDHYDCVVLTTNHSVYDPHEILESAKLIVDTRNAFKEHRNPRVFTLGVSNHSHKSGTVI